MRASGTAERITKIALTAGRLLVATLERGSVRLGQLIVLTILRYHWLYLLFEAAIAISARLCTLHNVFLAAELFDFDLL